jgi:hypothetical protein
VVMKRKSKEHLYKRIYGIRIFKEDLMSIIDIISSAEYKPILSDDEYEYDGLDELIGKWGTKPPGFKISAMKQRKDSGGGDIDDMFPPSSILSIEFKDHEVTISNLGYDTDSYYQINELLQKNSHKYHSWIGYNPVYWIGPLSIYFGVWMSYSTKSYFPITLVLLSLLLIFLFFYNLNNSFGVKFQKRGEGGFLNKNKDQIYLEFIKIIFSAIFGAILGRWITSLVKR